jgi:hypothetical protein
MGAYALQVFDCFFATHCSDSLGEEWRNGNCSGTIWRTVAGGGSGGGTRDASIMEVISRYSTCCECVNGKQKPEITSRHCYRLIHGD